MQNLASSSLLKFISKIGFIAKGLLYCLIGILAFMAAFELGRNASQDVDKQKAFNFIENLPAGKWLLAVVALGLLCYVLSQVIQAFTPSDNADSKVKNIFKRISHLLSGLAYLLVTLFALKMVFLNSENEKNSNQKIIQEIMQRENGEWLIGLSALVIAIVGIYQIYYSFSEGYRKDISIASMDQKNCELLLKSGKIGYVARGIVWLIIAWLFSKAAWFSNASEAGDTAEAFRFLEEASYGSYLLGALGLGLLCYGIFNFIRAFYEKLA
jgi:hypothetical protein